MRDPVQLHVRPALRDASLVLAFEGWNDAGAAATTAVSYVEEALHAVALGEIDCEELLDFTVTRPEVRVGESGRREVEWPRIALRFGSMDGSRDLVLGSGPEPHLRWRSFCESCAVLVRELEIQRVVLLGAYLADVVYSRPVSVTGFASDEALLATVGVPGSGYEGPTGILGVLGEHFAAQGVETVSLWAGLPHYISAAPNPRGALALVQKLVALLGLKLDLAGLQREAAEFEERVSALVASDPELSDYVRSLKKREFAQ